MSVGISYKGHVEAADDLAGRSVAEVRELYSPVFDIPDGARASLNGKKIDSKLESETRLNDCDELSFKGVSRRAPLLLAALLTALVATGSIFAFGYTTATITMVPSTRGYDFAKVEASDVYGGYTPAWSFVIGRFKGSLPSGDLFKVTQANEYTGDLVVKVYITNPDYLVNGFRHFGAKIQLRSAAAGGGSAVDKQAVAGRGNYQLLTLENSVVTFELDGSAGTAYYVYLAGGAYVSHPWGWITINADYVSPTFYCEVEQY